MDNELLDEIRLFLAQTGMGPSYFGKASCGNSELVERLESGRRVWPETAEKVRAFMAERIGRASDMEAAQ
jgi:hypothetical protein